MGLNVNLVFMLGISAASTCPKCERSFDNNYDVYDIEEGFPNRKKGVWELDCVCPFCEYEFTEKFVLTPEKISD